MKVAIYCRVSTEDQAEAKTIENQVEFAQRYCQLHNLEIYEFYLDDGVSGTIPLLKRPAGKRMFKDGKEGHFKAVYVYRLDRLARTTLDILNTHDKLDKLGIALKSMTESFDTSTPSGKFFMTTLGGIAEIERSTIAERMRLGKERAIKEGRWPGGPPPYGYVIKDKRLTVSQQEAEIIKLIFKLYTEAGMDTVAIADYLTATGYDTPTVSRNKDSKTVNVWYSSKVWAILQNTVYRGEFCYGKNRPKEKQLKFTCPAIIDQDQWDQAQKKLKSNYFNAKRNAKHQYLLRGLIKCGTCGRNYCGDGSHSKGRYHYYRCTGNSSFRGKLVTKCQSRSVRADLLEKVVWQDIWQYLTNNQTLINELLGLLNADRGRSATAAGIEELALLNKRISDKEREKVKILSLFRKSLINERDIEIQLRAINHDLAILNQRQRTIQNRQQQVTGPPVESFSMVKLLQEKLLAADIGLKRELMAILVKDIIVFSNDMPEKPQVTINYCFPFK
ncbi:recombinase family protein [Peptococcaceae bacterium 1198_IL3148]